MRWAKPEAAVSIENATEPALVAVAGVVLEAFTEGVLWWADQRLMVVADLHLEKGSSFARGGRMLPPYDTRSTLARLNALTDRLEPTVIVSLGDSFHDDSGAERLCADDLHALNGLQHGRDWVWIAGNHDPSANTCLPGDRCDSLALGPVRFVHEPEPEAESGEIAGHLHPAARVAGRGRSVRRRCFVGDGQRLILPAFGAYTGGLNILDKAYAGLFEPRSFRAFVMGDEKVYPVPTRMLRPD